VSSVTTMLPKQEGDTSGASSKKRNLISVNQVELLANEPEVNVVDNQDFLLVSEVIPYCIRCKSVQKL